MFAVVALTGAPAPAARALEPKQAVYVNLADSLQGSFDDLTQALGSAYEAAGFKRVAVHDVATERGACPYRARVLVLYEPRYAERLLAAGPNAAFAVPIRVLLYEDETGTHLATVNPLSINRTMVAETGLDAVSEDLVRTLARTAAGAVHGRFVARQFGQVRDRGLIGRTMGIMAGGPFPGKVKEVWSAPSTGPADLERVATAVWGGFEHGGGHGKWQVRGVYRLDIPEHGVVVLGVSGPALETKSYAIVGAGNDDARAHERCPGIAHAAAYPIEVVVYRAQGQVHVVQIDGMYRMKMYFEDAGKMKFAANMGMPGSIEDEVRQLVLAGVGARP